MESVSIRFSNIQSHENTAFVLKPGLNFILADDNNVGKSTIFKLLSYASRVPNVSYEDSEEILRVGADKGYAVFDYEDGTRTVLWLYRENGRVRSFFEHNGTRMALCPQRLLEALDIVMGTDGTPLNFNDADSVQLVVQDTPKNDEVIAKVLIDLKVENLKVNLTQLSKKIGQDYRSNVTRLEDAKSTLESLTFNMAVDSFNDDCPMMQAAANVCDKLLRVSISESPRVNVSEDEWSSISSAYNVLNALNDVYTPEQKELHIPKDIPEMTAALNVLNKLNSVDVSPAPPIHSETLRNMEKAISILSSLQRLYTSISYVTSAGANISKLSKEIEDISNELNQGYQRIKCPVKGDVYYSDERCVPCNH